MHYFIKFRYCIDHPNVTGQCSVNSDLVGEIDRKILNDYASIMYTMAEKVAKNMVFLLTFILRFNFLYVCPQMQSQNLRSLDKNINHNEMFIYNQKSINARG